MIEITFEKAGRRAAAYDGDRLAGVCNIVLQKTFWIIKHTEVDPACSGQGLAGKLVACVMDAAEREHVKVKPFCSYAAHQFDKNPAYAAMEDRSVITVFGMKSCPDCRRVYDQIGDSRHFRIVEIGENVKNMKAFTRLRDISPQFREAKKTGSIGIPCFVMEDGTLTLDPEEVGLASGADSQI